MSFIKLTHLFRTSLNSFDTIGKKYKRLFSSALYITGDKAHDTFVVLTPYIDFDDRLRDKQQLENCIKHRQTNVNLDEVIKLWNFYKEVQSKKTALNESRSSISQTITALHKKGDKYLEKINVLKAHGKMIKEDLKHLNESFWSVEEKAAISVLSLPNILHKNTPLNDREHELFSYLDKPVASTDRLCHVEIAKKLDLLEFINPVNYYLKNDAALFEQCSLFQISDRLLEKSYVQFSNSDFSRSVIVEGCGLNFQDPKLVFSLVEDDSEHKHEFNRVHLTGGASLSAFMAYFCRHTIFPSILPVKYFTIGRKYQPVSADSASESLFNVTQESAISLFVATVDDAQKMAEEFDKVLADVIEIYKSFNCHFRVCYLPAPQLNNWECLRASIQMFSTHLNKYIEVGHVSMCDNYISKRLLFNYGKGLNINFPCIITGTILSVPKFLGCILEAQQESATTLPDIIKRCNSL